MTTTSYTPLQHQEQYTIRAYEIDNRKQATVPALVKLMHECALQNVLKLKLSVWDLEPLGISWVLMRKSLHISRLPSLGETITILTHPAGFEKFFTYRDYRVFDRQGEQIAASSSTWMLMNTETRQLARIPSSILRLQEQMPPEERCLPRPAGRLPRIERPERAKSYEVNWYDLDFNMHLNNTFYLKWMLEALPENTLRNDRLQQIELLYRAEALWEDPLLAEVQPLGDGQYLHRLIRSSDDKELAIARSAWVPWTS